MKKWIAICLAAVSVCFTGCQRGRTQEIQTNPLLQGFETMEDYLLFDYDGKYGSNSTYFGDITANKDAQYITEGTGSMRYEVADMESYPDQYMASTFLVPTKNGETDYSDFRKVKSISVDVYNDTDTDVDLSVCPANILGKTWALQQRSLMTYTNYVLPAKSWTKVTYTVDRAFIDMVLDVQSIGWIAFRFGGVNAVVYLDNLRVQTTTDPYIAPEFLLDENEVCSFDKEYQQIVAFPYKNTDVKLQIELNTDRQYSVSGNSLKVTIPANDKKSDYIIMKLSDKLMSAVNLGSYDKNAKFAFDVKKMYDKEQWIIPLFKNTYWGTQTQINGVNIPAGQDWWTFEVAIENIGSSPDALELWFPIAGTTDRVLYFDNFRIIP